MLEQLTNIVYDTNYTDLVPKGGFVVMKDNEVPQVFSDHEKTDTPTTS